MIEHVTTSNNVEVVQENSRAVEVKEQLSQIKHTIEDTFFVLCDLLREAKEEALYEYWGFTRFDDWVSTASGLDISPRQAYYLVSVSKKSEQLGLTKDQMKLARVSKLKSILSLDIDQFHDEMIDLVNDAPIYTLEEINAKVAALKAGEGHEPTMYMTLKLNASIKETVHKAFELARNMYGTNDNQGDPIDISDSKCMELICQSYVLDPNNVNQQ